MTDKLPDARKMIAAEYHAARDGMWRDAAARRLGLLQQSATSMYCDQRLPDHEAWLEQHGKRDAPKSGEVSKAPDDAGDEGAAERLAAIAERNEAVAEMVRRQVRQ
jgi:hypothetical protein